MSDWLKIAREVQLQDELGKHKSKEDEKKREKEVRASEENWMERVNLRIQQVANQMVHIGLIRRPNGLELTGKEVVGIQLQGPQNFAIKYFNIMPATTITVNRPIRIQHHRVDLKQIRNLKNIDPKFMHLPYDPQNEFSVPFLWSTSGIGYNKTKVTDTVDSWAILWNPKYKEKISMLDDMRETFSAALKLRGHSINSSSSADWDDAKQLLMMQKPLLKAYNSTNFDELLLSGDVWLAHSWSGNIVIAMNQNPQLSYVVPKEGSVISVDNFAIPANSSHLQEATALISFCLDAKVGAEITNYNYYPNTNIAAKAYIRPEILNNKISYPDPDTMARCELMQSLGDLNQKIDRYWTEIKSR